ncbi:hypothetical protein H0A36_21705 [Endozoicomonas sp. SM1973]|uniref:Uncharacterized protein n=1 Tax=Spartinivicinus marinus TaxID=2994442 RepID=A0A853ILL1_9GAMM|nr:hypothetical protein [Spartinivicinus marinus]MCX4028365.1 hypothetical protein [Spartinivicinus marinus]NYZ68636.1 hypothetical protein [Spartinivicinus marinus]
MTEVVVVNIGDNNCVDDAEKINYSGCNKLVEANKQLLAINSCHHSDDKLFIKLNYSFMHVSNRTQFSFSKY